MIHNTIRRSEEGLLLNAYLGKKERFNEECSFYGHQMIYTLCSESGAFLKIKVDAVVRIKLLSFWVLFRELIL